MGMGLYMGFAYPGSIQKPPRQVPLDCKGSSTMWLIRGASFKSGPNDGRVADRDRVPSGKYFNSVGFRVVRSQFAWSDLK